jgi:large subunit ribosomal protein L15
MRLHDLKPTPGSQKKRVRVGRGIAAGKGKTAGRGTKGMGARRGGGKGAFFEGGQLPLVRRLPFKRGFTNIFRIEHQEVNVRFLEARFNSGDVVNPQTLYEKGLVRDPQKPVVVMGKGELTKKLTVHAHRFTKGATEKITNAGGSVNKLTLKVIGARVTVKLLSKEKLAKLQAE